MMRPRIIREALKAKPMIKEPRERKRMLRRARKRSLVSAER